MTDRIRSFLAFRSSESSCPFDPLDSIGPIVGPLGPVCTSLSSGPYTGLVGPVSESYARFPRLGLSGVRSQLRVSRGVATAGVLVKVLNHLPSGCLGMTRGVRVVTGGEWKSTDN